MRHPFSPITSPWSDDDLEEIDSTIDSFGNTRRRWRVKEGRFLAGTILTESGPATIRSELVSVEPPPEPTGTVFYFDVLYGNA